MTVRIAQDLGRVMLSLWQSAMATPASEQYRKEKAVPSRASATIIMAMPLSSSVRRPNWSTRQTAKKVARSFTAPTPRDDSAAVDAKPASLKMSVAK
eukprot:CAMPEP_0115110320 /NCGR_PEP_ID=MMETSP0227-20121206/39311_1 /TAXON_ID=89957 /ORGANISM="Polarella glacialis, Strain CCMP 1383" /LENGTH=96 /DNA_ID=CAMNT_0002509347 /DNA_START=345 /DNA_END=635 /DNA_ORIENTATION=+